MVRVLRREPVSSRAPVWGASVEQLQRENELLFQVVPPCGGHLWVVVIPGQLPHVSSRAPVWGASAASR